MKQLSVQDIIQRVDGKATEGLDLKKIITGAAGMHQVTENDVTFFSMDSFTRQTSLKDIFEKAKAGLFLAKEKDVIPGKPFVIVSNPKEAMQKVLHFFYGPIYKTGIDPSAKIDPSVKFINKETVYIAENVIIRADVTLGENVQIGPNTVIHSDTQIGDNTRIEDNVSIEKSTLGKNCWIGPGARIGGQGFGYSSGPQGHHHMEHIGRVVVGDHVDIGMNACVARGAFDDTEIGDGTKIDALVQVGHGVKVGKHCFLCAQVGMAGGTVLKDFVFAGGQVGFGGHLTVQSGTQIAGQSGIISDIKKPGIYMGFPAEPRTSFLRKQIALKKLSEKK